MFASRFFFKHVFTLFFYPLMCMNFFVLISCLSRSKYFLSRKRLLYLWLLPKFCAVMCLHVRVWLLLEKCRLGFLGFNATSRGTF